MKKKVFITMFLLLIGIMLFGLSGTVSAETCGRCGKSVKIKTHEGVRYPDTSCQYYRCSCGYTDGWSHRWNVTTTAATCTTAETTSYSCSRNISYHQYSVTTGSALGHNYSSTVTKSATCTSSGTRKYTCSRCSASYTETISALGHSYSSATCTKPATCTRSGCGATSGSALGHSYSSTVTKSATCTSSGTMKYTCSRCGDTYTTSISATGHSYGSYTVTREATCTVDGVKTRTCSRCGGTDSAVIPATGHSYGAYTVTKVATCTVNGVKTRTCSKCGGTDTLTISATGHSYTGTCPLCGTTNVVCTNTGCGNVKSHTCDVTPPTVSFGTNGSTSPVSKASTKITITDASAIDTSSLKYLWTQSTTAPAESSFTQSFTNGQTITFSGKTGKWYLWILAKDTAGNTAIVSSGAFELDSEAPEGTMSIKSVYEEDGVKYTNTNTLTINLTATDNISTEANMKVALINETDFSFSNPNSDIVWMSFAATKTWNSSAGDGLKRIYVIFQDEAGNQSVYLAQ